MQKTLVCLANSYKHGGRCVAGICVETGKWIRLRSPNGDGSLAPMEYTLSEGHGPVRLLDVFAVDLHYALPTECHPEDWVPSPAWWKLVERPCSEKTWLSITANIRKGGALLGGYSDRVWSTILRNRPASSSLTLVCPTDLWWWNREEHGKLKHRALFRRDNVTYDLAVTDPCWLEHLKKLPFGVHPHREVAPQSRETWLTVSLSEAFSPGGGGSAHFRLVAAVIVH